MGKDALLAELGEAALTMIQGSLSEVTRQCGDPSCACAWDPQRRHGPHLYLKFSAEGKFLPMWGFYGQGEPPAAFWGPRDIAVSPDERLIAAAGRGNPDVTVWDPASGALLFTLAGHFSGGGSLAFSPDSLLLATAGNDGVVRIWDMESGQLLYLVGHRGGNVLSILNYQVWVVSFSPDGRTLLTGGEDGTVRLWDVQTGAELAIIRVVDPTIISQPIISLSP